MKVYLVGYLYDDFSYKGFSVLKIASTEEKAQVMLRFLKEENPDGGGLMGYEIREWEVDNIHPVAEIVRHGSCYAGIDFEYCDAMPYRLIKPEDSKEDKKDGNND